jgi:hypothetical protein
MPYVGEHDLGLLFSIAGWRYPELSERFFVWYILNYYWRSLYPPVYIL